MNKAFTFLGLTLVGLLGSIPLRLKVEGAWKIVEVQTIKADRSVTVTQPVESLVYFGKGYYSFCWTSHSNPARTWQMTDSSKLNRANQSIINTGTYTLEGDILKTRAMFAQNPMFVGGEATFRCRMSGDTLFLEGLSVNSSENVINPVYAAGSHILNKLVRIR